MRIAQNFTSRQFEFNCAFNRHCKPPRAEAIHPCSRQFIRGYCRVTATMDRLEFAMRERKRRENLNDNN